MLNAPTISGLGIDPAHRTHRINANSFQQNAIITINSWQYAAFYTDATSPKIPGALSINLARRDISKSLINKTKFQESKWEYFTFEDYEQLVDDGHKVISIGICKGDGTIHVAFDHHCDRLRFRISKTDIISSPETHEWSPSLFSEIQDSLPGIIATRKKELFEEITYPRFVSAGDDMVLSFRIGKAGAGSDVLYTYSPITHTYTYVGIHLTGISNNPYINSLSYSPSPNRLHISWTYRAFVDYIDETPGSVAHKAQAGPNGPENNYDLYYAYSEDLGRTWKSSAGEIVAVVDEISSSGTLRNTILPDTEGIRVVEIPKGSGILNQEGQCVDGLGGVFVLNRENRSGKEKWTVYWKRGQDQATSTWHTTPLTFPPSTAGPTPTERGQRGSIAADNSGNVWIVLQDNVSPRLYVIKAGVISRERNEEELVWNIWWSGDGFDGELLIDEARLMDWGVLSIFTRTDRDVDGKRDVVILDFDVREGDKQES